MSDRFVPPGGVLPLRSRLVENLPVSLWAHWRAVLAGFAVLVAVAAWVIPALSNQGLSSPRSSGPPENSLPRVAPTDAPKPVTPDVVVQISGAVANPGVFSVASTARINDAIEAAGGLSADADVERVNLAAKVSDGQRVYVLRRGQQVAPDVAASSGDAATGETSSPVDLNTAPIDALDKLPGVGPATASAIVEYRKSHGPFRNVGDLAKVKGIGPAKLLQIKPLVRV